MKHFLGKVYMGLFVWLCCTNLYAQTYTFQGIVADNISKEPLVGVSVRLNATTGTKTNSQGKFSLILNILPQTIELTYIGYAKNAFTITSSNLQTDTIFLKPENIELNQVVVSASRQEQKLEEVTQSMEIVRPQFLVNTQTNQVQELMEKLPGVQVQKEQVTLRGGSGFSYGAGSRVLILFDEMPMLSADASDAKWSYFPIENIEQIEILKGAASALYGSSALEGLISLSVLGAADTAYTQIKAFGGFYDFPEAQKADMKGVCTKMGISAAHRRRIGQLQLITSANLYTDKGYRKDDTDSLVRGNIKVIYTPKRNDKWSLSFSLNGMNNRGKDFLFFAHADKPYEPFNGTTSSFNNSRWHSDFNVKYYASAKSKHILRARYFSTINKNNPAQSSTGNLLFSEYQYQHILLDQKMLRTTITTGISNTYTQTISGILYGNHSGNNAAGYFQVDQKVGRLNISHGTRLETNKMDTFSLYVLPVSRTGLNFEATKSTFLRLSYGQGFRYPSVAERFIRTQSGGLRIFPNINLKPEKGYSAEIGIKQLFLYKKLKGYVDFSGFTSSYENMIEYVFGLYTPPNTLPSLDHLGFAAQNIAQTKIHGAEFSTALSQKMGKAQVNFYGGYTYILPLDEKYKNKDTLDRLKYLKFRRQHLVRGNLDVSYRKISCGIYTFYNSPTKNIDDFFLDLIGGIKQNDYWQTYSEGMVTDARLSYKPSGKIDISLFCKNIFNKAYMEVPGNTNPPRNFSIQLTAQF
ncbi:MAG: TonB-dependent receptor [Bacteroidia bacterium]